MKNITGISAPSGKRIKLADSIPLDTPLIIQIFDIYACNLSCKFCHYGLPKKERPVLTTRKRMSLILFKKIIDDMTTFKRKIKLLRFCGAGESLLDKNIIKMIEYASEKQVAEKIELITNGILLTPKMSTALINAGLSQIRISIYGLSSKKYKELCNANINFDNIVDNVKFFYKENKNKAMVYVKTMNCSLNMKEDETKFIKLFENHCDSYAIESVVPNVQGLDYSEWLKDGIPSYNALGIELPKITICPQPFHLITICPDGNVVPCTNELMLSIGNCNTQSIADIWHSNTLRRCQYKMLNGSIAFGKTCKTCSIVQCRPFPEDIIDNDAERLRKLYEK